MPYTQYLIELFSTRKHGSIILSNKHMGFSMTQWKIRCVIESDFIHRLGGGSAQVIDKINRDI